MNKDTPERHALMNAETIKVCGPSGFRYGAAVLTPGKGWRFIPNVAGRMPSRKYHQTAEASIPRWAKDGVRS